MKEVTINSGNLTVRQVALVAEGAKVSLDPAVTPKILASRNYVEKLVEGKDVVYGINTGFGKFSNVIIPKEDLKELQRNLIISHACGVGNLLSRQETRAVMLLRANALAKGYSGVRLEIIEKLIAMLNNDICPLIPEKGSLGASGDLAPLAHMVLTLIGEGDCYYKGTLTTAASALKSAGITPAVLMPKEGLALINGTQVMTAIGALTAYKAINLFKLCDIAAALTMEALNGVTDAFLPILHSVRPHKGQINTAANLLKILENSKRTTRQGEIKVQDAYSLRCAPQVHGASKDALNYVLSKLEIEINSVTDNPIIAVEQDMAVSCGNFHGQPMALAFDFMAIALAEMANISERRIERLVNPALSGLPAFLIENGGINSGFMIAQYSAAALVSENKVLAHPASVDSIPSSANQEDHVSMGTIAARKARDIAFNLSRVIMIELIAACQAIDLSQSLKDMDLGKGTRTAYKLIREKVGYIEKDVTMHQLFEKAAELVDSPLLAAAVEAATGSL